ncbi:hypothetical protein [Mesorhizobium loti]|uniref:hypothetical protein n=1 Tax=Rhizobium loti TaxID=381 RepID=UPI0012678B20|nr:hypothetical protein [Mesorhizobium loti]
MHDMTKSVSERLSAGNPSLLAVCVLVICGGIAGFAYSSGHRAGRVSQLKDTVSAYNRRMGIADYDNRLGTVDLCQEIGGLRDECAKLAPSQ